MCVRTGSGGAKESDRSSGNGSSVPPSTTNWGVPPVPHPHVSPPVDVNINPKSLYLTSTLEVGKHFSSLILTYIPIVSLNVNLQYWVVVLVCLPRNLGLHECGGV